MCALLTRAPDKLPIDKQLILDSLAAIARGAGRAPSQSEFVSLSGISEHQVSQFFPTWNEAVRDAGLVPNTLNVRLEDRQLLEDWAFVVRSKGKIPARRTYRHLGQYNPGTFLRFGPWSKLPEVFRKFAQNKPEWADVVALIDVGARVEDAGLKSPALHLVLGEVPLSKGGPLSRGTEGPPSSLAPNDNLTPKGVSYSGVRHAAVQGRPTYGNPIDFRGLRHEPVNEQGVVLLFGLVAKELGYIVEAVQSGFPDCEAKRRIGPQRWQRVHIEFEFESRSFRDHGHALTGCDVIVCWRHNWPDCPQHIEILELSTLIQSLAASE